MRICSPLFPLVPREIAVTEAGGNTEPLVEFLISLSLSLSTFAREFVPGWPGAKRKFSPVLLFVVDSTLLGLSPTVVSRVGVCFIIGSWSKWMLGVLVTMMLNPRSLARFSDEWAV